MDRSYIFEYTISFDWLPNKNPVLHPEISPATTHFPCLFSSASCKMTKKGCLCAGVVGDTHRYCLLLGKIRRNSDLYFKFLFGRKSRAPLLLDLLNCIFVTLGYPWLKEVALTPNWFRNILGVKRPSSISAPSMKTRGSSALSCNANHSRNSSPVASFIGAKTTCNSWARGERTKT